MKNWIPVQTVPVEGKELVLDPTADWAAYLEEFSLPYDVADLSVRITLLPQAEGMLVRGALKGTVTLPCTRCAEDARIALDRAFDAFEPYPVGDVPFEPPVRPFSPSRSRERGAWKPKAQEKDRRVKPEHEDDSTLPDMDVDENVVRETPRGLEINVVNLAFQEFLLALPLKALCSPGCRGICPRCGQNLNVDVCACSPENGDPRLAALRNLKLGKPK